MAVATLRSTDNGRGLRAMISAMQGRFANLGMAKKLGIGFVLVLLLTALVAAIGVWSLQTISQRFDGLKQMSSLNSGLLKVRLYSPLDAAALLAAFTASALLGCSHWMLVT